jgi:hypothetical protein
LPDNGDDGDTGAVVTFTTGADESIVRPSGGNCANEDDDGDDGDGNVDDEEADTSLLCVVGDCLDDGGGSMADEDRMRSS